MGMGFGCNAAGVISTRIIDSPRERLIAIITNNFVPCNGRWPTIIMLASVFVAASFPEKISAVVAASTVVGVTLFGVLVTLLVSKFLSSTALKGEASTFKLELPPYRKPQILRILYRSLIDRTIFVLGRAVVMAAPAGGLIWLLGNIHIDGISLMAYAVNTLQPVGKAIGLDGVILLAYIIAIPANEIIIPTIIMAYSAGSRMMELEIDQLKELFLQNEWTILTAISLMFFSLLHYPCSTTTWTIWKETKSVKWTLISNLLPLAITFIVCFLIYRIGLIFL
jgi:ferrous iron transport protein B